MKKIVYSLMVTLLMVPSVSASKQYVAQPGQSEWKMVVNTPLQCQLNHPIPSYGDATFTSMASKKINLDFELKMRRAMGETRNVSLVSMPPRWMPGESAESITHLRFYKQFDGYVGGQTAWGLLAELESGRYPTFTYSDWQNRDKLIEVSLSSVMFQSAYDEFSTCVSNLLPYSFEDISFTILHYSKNSDQLNKASQKRLSQIAEYVRYSDDIDLVLVSTYTDSSGGKNVNQNLSEKRAKRLQEYFESIGMPGDRIQVQGYGKRRPIADNDTPIGKDKNRRVVISLGRTLI